MNNGNRHVESTVAIIIGATDTTKNGWKNGVKPPVAAKPPALEEKHMTLKVDAMIHTAVPFLLRTVKLETWNDVVALRFLISDAKALLKEAEARIKPPPAHKGPDSGHKLPQSVLERAAALNKAAKAMNAGLDLFLLLGKSLKGMRVFELQEIAASASTTARIAEALLIKIGANAEPTALISAVLSEKQIKQVFATELGKKKITEYRDVASPPS